MYRDVKMAVIMNMIYIHVLVVGSLEDAKQLRLRRSEDFFFYLFFPFIYLFIFLNKAIQQSTDGALQTPIWCECEKEIYQTGQGHLHKASVRSTVHLQIEQRRRAKVKKKNQNEKPAVLTLAKQ